MFTLVIAFVDWEGNPQKRVFSNVRIYGGIPLNHDAHKANGLLSNVFGFPLNTALLLCAIYGGKFVTSETMNGSVGSIRYYRH